MSCWVVDGMVMGLERDGTGRCRKEEGLGEGHRSIRKILTSRWYKRSTVKLKCLAVAAAVAAANKP